MRVLMRHRRRQRRMLHVFPLTKSLAITTYAERSDIPLYALEVEIGWDRRCKMRRNKLLFRQYDDERTNERTGECWCATKKYGILIYWLLTFNWNTFFIRHTENSESLDSSANQQPQSSGSTIPSANVIYDLNEINLLQSIWLFRWKCFEFYPVLDRIYGICWNRLVDEWYNRWLALDRSTCENQKRFHYCFTHSLHFSPPAQLSAFHHTDHNVTLGSHCSCACVCVYNSMCKQNANDVLLWAITPIWSFF